MSFNNPSLMVTTPLCEAVFLGDGYVCVGVVYHRAPWLERTTGLSWIWWRGIN